MHDIVFKIANKALFRIQAALQTSDLRDLHRDIYAIVKAELEDLVVQLSRRENRLDPLNGGP